MLQENAAVHYKYVTDTELSGQEKDLIVKDIPKIAEDSESTYYLVYRMDEKAQLGQLPNTGGRIALLAFYQVEFWLRLVSLFLSYRKRKAKRKLS